MIPVGERGERSENAEGRAVSEGTPFVLFEAWESCCCLPALLTPISSLRRRSVRAPHPYLQRRATATATPLVGCDAAMAELRAFILTPLANPSLLRDLGLRGATGALLHGPPGCGKTSVARALAAEVQGIANFLEVRCSDLVDKVRMGKRLLACCRVSVRGGLAVMSWVIVDETTQMLVEEMRTDGDVSEGSLCCSPPWCGLTLARARPPDQSKHDDTATSWSLLAAFSSRVEVSVRLGRSSCLCYRFAREDGDAACRDRKRGPRAWVRRRLRCWNLLYYRAFQIIFVACRCEACCLHPRP